MTVVQSGLVFDAGMSQYCAGDSARGELITMHGWTVNDAGRNCCTEVTTWTGGVWDNGVPTSMHHAIFSDDYHTAVDGGGFEACRVSIDPGATVTVEAGDTILIDAMLEVGGVLDVKAMGEVLLGE